MARRHVAIVRNGLFTAEYKVAWRLAAPFFLFLFFFPATSIKKAIRLIHSLFLREWTNLDEKLNKPKNNVRSNGLEWRFRFTKQRTENINLHAFTFLLPQFMNVLHVQHFHFNYCYIQWNNFGLHHQTIAFFLFWITIEGPWRYLAIHR